MLKKYVVYVGLVAAILMLGVAIGVLAVTGHPYYSQVDWHIVGTIVSAIAAIATTCMVYLSYHTIFVQPKMHLRNKICALVIELNNYSQVLIAAKKSIVRTKAPPQINYLRETFYEQIGVDLSCLESDYVSFAMSYEHVRRFDENCRTFLTRRQELPNKLPEEEEPWFQDQCKAMLDAIPSAIKELKNCLGILQHHLQQRD